MAESKRKPVVAHSGRRCDAQQKQIIPLLTALGWDTSDPEQVVYEYRRRSKDLPVDFALMLQRTPSLFVEAKSLGHDITDRKWTNQIIWAESIHGERKTW